MFYSSLLEFIKSIFYMIIISIWIPDNWILIILNYIYLKLRNLLMFMIPSQKTLPKPYGYLLPCAKMMNCLWTSLQNKRLMKTRNVKWKYEYHRKSDFSIQHAHAGAGKSAFSVYLRKSLKPTTIIKFNRIYFSNFFNIRNYSKRRSGSCCITM